MSDTTVTSRPRFWQRRALPATHETRLRHRRVYILPTQYGMLFGLILLVMLLGSINYNNNMGYMLTFLLASTAMVSILHTHRMLLGLHVLPAKVEPVFVGEIAQFHLWLDNHQQPARYALQWQFDTEVNLWRSTSQAPPIVDIDVPSNTRQLLIIPKQAEQRGYLALGQLMVSSQFPLGLFRAWSYVHIDLQAIVYPKPLGQRTLPQGQASPDKMGDSATPSSGGDDFIGYRHYHLGDAPRHIDWKAVARRQEWLVKQFGGSGTATLWLRFEQVQHLPHLEHALSQLCLWILVATQHNVEYGLILPHQTIAPSMGEAHRRTCLTALALYGHNT